MTEELDVLILENRPGAATGAANKLSAAGHRVHRCHDVGDASFPCKGVEAPGDCPLDAPVDVALVVRRGVTPRPTAYEHGVMCAIQQGVPIVEAGRDILDPFEPWVTERREDEDDLDEACRSAVTKGFAPLREAILERVTPVLTEHGLTAGSAQCVLERRNGALMVHVEVDGELDAQLEQAVAVRAFDAIRADRRRFDEVDVEVVPRG